MVLLVCDNNRPCVGRGSTGTVTVTIELGAVQMQYWSERGCLAINTSTHGHGAHLFVFSVFINSHFSIPGNGSLTRGGMCELDFSNLAGIADDNLMLSSYDCSLQ